MQPRGVGVDSSGASLEAEDAVFRIGDFSQLGQVSVRTLRHYDDLGLLKPAEVDPLTDYRSYTIEQLPRLNRIVALKDMGFSLKEIHGFLEQDVSLGDLRGLLEHKQAELTAQLEAEQARLRRLRARLEQIALEDAPLGFDVTLKGVPATTVFSKRYAVPDLEEMDRYCTLFYEELYTVLNVQKLVPIAPEFTLFHTREYVTKNVDVEVAVVLSSGDLARLELPDDDSFTVRRLQGSKTAASVVFEGYFHELGGAARALLLWTGMNGYESVGAAREIHLSGPIVETGKDEPVVIELQVPVAPHTARG
jgi:DNA-binding transcriptional MerR regulator